MGNEDKKLEELNLYAKVLRDLAVDMEKTALTNDNPNVGSISDVLKVVVASMENPVMIEELVAQMKIFAGYQIFELTDKFEDGSIQNALNNYYNFLDGI